MLPVAVSSIGLSYGLMRHIAEIRVPSGLVLPKVMVLKLSAQFHTLWMSIQCMPQADARISVVILIETCRSAHLIMSLLSETISIVSNGWKSSRDAISVSLSKIAICSSSLIFSVNMFIERYICA